MTRRLVTSLVASARWLASLAVVLAAGAVGLADWTATWTPTASLAPDRERAASTFLPPTCEILLYGGVAASGVATDSTFIYEPASDTWTALRPQKGITSVPGLSLAGLTWDDDQQVAVLFGGFGASSSNRVFLFDPFTRKWSSAESNKNCRTNTCPGPRYSHGQAWSNDIRATLVFGGVGQATSPPSAYGDLWALRAVPARKGGLTWSWSRLAPVADSVHGLPPARSWHGMAEVPTGPDRGKILIYGGMDASRQRLSDTWLYDPTSLTFEFVDAAPPKASQMFAMGYSPSLGAIVIHGGYDRAGSVDVNETWAFDADTREWAKVSTSNEPGHRASHDLASDPSGVCSDRAYVVDAPFNSNTPDYTWSIRRP